MKAVILAGGEGTRLHPITHDIPKPLVPVLNRPLLEHTIASLKKYQVRDIVLAVSYLPEVIQRYFDNGATFGVKLTYAIEDSPLGTAGAVKNAEHNLDDTVAVLNGDTFSDIDLADMIAFHRYKKAKVTIALTRVDNPCAFGVVETDSYGRVKQFIEKPSPNEVTTNWINAGIYIIESEILEHVPGGSYYTFEKGLFPFLLELGESIYGYLFSGYWLDMGTLEKYMQLNFDLLLSKAKSALIDSLGKDEVRCDERVIIHPSAKIVGPAMIGSNCSIGGGAHIMGPVIIGSDCSVGEDTIVEEAVLWKGVNIGKGAELRRCIVGSHTTVGNNSQVIGHALVGNHIRIIGNGRQ